MSGDLNYCSFIGRLGKDPESKSFANGGSVTNCTLAVGQKWKDKEGNPQEKTEWINLVFRNKLGEIAAQYLRKGSKVFVSGEFTTRKWQDKTSGQDKYITEVVCQQMQMLDGKPADAPARTPSRQSTAEKTQSAPFVDDEFSDVPW